MYDERDRKREIEWPKTSVEWFLDTKHNSLQYGIKEIEGTIKATIQFIDKKPVDYVIALLEATEPYKHLLPSRAELIDAFEAAK